MDVSSSVDNDDMYVRARQKHTKAVEREQTVDVKEEIVAEDIAPPPKPAVKVRRVNDETSKTYDDEQISMGVGLAGKKKRAEKAAVVNDENDLSSAVMPIASEKKRLAEESRIDRIRRLCEKRTVGDALEAAQNAYRERQQRREQFKDYIERAE